jgi:hypothetical protein
MCLLPAADACGDRFLGGRLLPRDALRRGLDVSPLSVFIATARPSTIYAKHRDAH